MKDLAKERDSVVVFGPVSRTLYKQAMREAGYRRHQGDRVVVADTLWVPHLHEYSWMQPRTTQEVLEKVVPTLVVKASEEQQFIDGQLRNPLLRNVGLIVYEASMPLYDTPYGDVPELFRRSVHQLQHRYGWPGAKVYAVARDYRQRRW